MNRNNIIIIAIIIIAVVVIGAFVAMNLSTTPTTADNKTTITANGTKITIINNNQDVWAHWKLQLQNAPEKNGSQQTYYVDAYIKPGENTTFDLSSMLGYGEEALPQDTNITVLGWGGLYNQTANGESKFNTTFFGWTTNQTVPSPAATYQTASNPLEVDPDQTIGTLPANITDNTVNIGTSDPGTLSNDELFTQFNIIIGPDGLPFFELRGTPILCEVIAQT